MQKQETNTKQFKTSNTKSHVGIIVIAAIVAVLAILYAVFGGWAMNGCKDLVDQAVNQTQVAPNMLEFIKKLIPFMVACIFLFGVGIALIVKQIKWSIKSKKITNIGPVWVTRTLFIVLLVLGVGAFILGAMMAYTNLAEAAKFMPQASEPTPLETEKIFEYFDKAKQWITISGAIIAVVGAIHVGYSILQIVFKNHKKVN